VGADRALLVVATIVALGAVASNTLSR